MHREINNRFIIAFATRTEKENGEELTTVLKEDSADNEARFLLQLYKNPVAQYLVDRLAIVSNFFSIWLWAEHRKRYHDLNKGELLDAWSSELEDLDSQIENFVHSVKLVNCQLDYEHASKKSLSVECKKMLKQHKHSTKTPYIPIISNTGIQSHKVSSLK